MEILNTIFGLILFIGAGYFAYMSSILVSEKKARQRAGITDYYDNPLPEKEGSWYEGGNPHKDDNNYDPEVDDWDTDMEFNCNYMGVSRLTCNKRVCEKSHRIGELNDRTKY